MMMIKRTMQLVEAADSVIDGRYGIEANNLVDICTASSDEYMRLIYAFRFGYMRGKAATEAEHRAQLRQIGGADR